MLRLIFAFLFANFTHADESHLIILRDQSHIEASYLLPSAAARLQFLVQSRRQVAISGQSGLVNVFARLGLPYRQYYAINAIAVDGLSDDQVNQISQLAEVKRVLPNRMQKWRRDLPLLPVSPSAAGANVQAIGAERVWLELGVRGEGVVVAGQDTGVEWGHSALRNSYRGNTKAGVRHDYNWYDAIRRPVGAISRGNPCGYASAEPCDDNDHGTHTMGTMVGDGGPDKQIGVAPGAQWIACRNMDLGFGSPETYLKCFEFFLAPYTQGQNGITDGRPEMAPNVINNSWGCPSSEGCFGGEMTEMLKMFRAAGILVVASAGNDGPGCGTIGAQPANVSESTFSVGAADHRNGRIASFSSRGPSTFDGQIGPDIVAPGVAILSSVRDGKYQGGFWSGTSMSGPHVAGAVALLWSAVPSLKGNIDETEDILRRSAKPITATESCGGVPGSQIPNNTYGYGMIDIFSAIQLARQEGL